MLRCLLLLHAQWARKDSCHPENMGVCPACSHTKRTAPVRFEVAMQSAFQENYSYMLGARGLLGGGSAMERQMRAYPVVNEMGYGKVLVVAGANFANSSLWDNLMHY